MGGHPLPHVIQPDRPGIWGPESGVSFQEADYLRRWSHVPFFLFFRATCVPQGSGRAPWSCCRRRKPSTWRVKSCWIGSRSWRTAATCRSRSWARPAHRLRDCCGNAPATRPSALCSRRRRRNCNRLPWRRPAAGPRVTNRTDVSRHRNLGKKNLVSLAYVIWSNRSGRSIPFERSWIQLDSAGFSRIQPDPRRILEESPLTQFWMFRYFYLY